MHKILDGVMHRNNIHKDTKILEDVLQHVFMQLSRKPTEFILELFYYNKKNEFIPEGHFERIRGLACNIALWEGVRFLNSENHHPSQSLARRFFSAATLASYLFCHHMKNMMKTPTIIDWYWLMNQQKMNHIMNTCGISSGLNYHRMKWNQWIHFWPKEKNRADLKTLNWKKEITCWPGLKKSSPDIKSASEAKRLFSIPLTIKRWTPMIPFNVHPKQPE